MGNTGVAKMHKGLGMMLALLALLLMVQPADAAPKRKQAAQLEQMQAAVLLPDGCVAADLSGRYVAIAKG